MGPKKRLAGTFCGGGFRSGVLPPEVPGSLGRICGFGILLPFVAGRFLAGHFVVGLPSRPDYSVPMNSVTASVSSGASPSVESV